MELEKNNDTITFVLFMYNEEKRVEWSIRNLLPWGKVLIVDNYSEDRTVEIARSYGCEVLMHKNPGWAEDSVTVSKVKAAVHTEWIYWGAADELLDEPSLIAITEAVKSRKYCIVNIARKNYYYGKFCHNAFAHRMNRIFKKDALDFSENTIHQFGKVVVSEDQICHLPSKKYFVRHFISNNVKSYLRVMDRYTDTQSLTATGHRSGLFLALRACKTFTGNYFIRGAYKAGTAGLSLTFLTVFYDWLLAMKVYEHQHHLDVDEIERLNNTERHALLEASSKSKPFLSPV